MENKLVLLNERRIKLKEQAEKQRGALTVMLDSLQNNAIKPHYLNQNLVGLQSSDNPINLREILRLGYFKRHPLMLLSGGLILLLLLKNKQSAKWLGRGLSLWKIVHKLKNSKKLPRKQLV